MEKSQIVAQSKGFPQPASSSLGITMQNAQKFNETLKRRAAFAAMNAISAQNVAG